MEYKMGTKKEKTVEFIHHFFPEKKVTENFIQYMLRQIYFSDTSGRPSVTVTILLFVMFIVGIVAGIESTVALSQVKTVKPDGTTITMLKGFGSEFMYLMIALSVVITKYFNDRSERHMHYSPKDGAPSDAPPAGGNAGAPLSADSIISSAVGMVAKIKGAK